MTFALRDSVGLVAIGRNEGDRLGVCLKSARGELAHIVYVDSGSTDGSVELARALGVDVVELDMDRPFTAARARNAGWHRLRELAPPLAFVQFVDGDCELEPGWLAFASDRLRGSPELAAVGGRRRERHRDATIYNRLCDMEWARPPGVDVPCGGDAMMRVAALEQVGGFDGSVIAGEEPELCVRLRQRGWATLRVDLPMTVHDAAMTRASQWWRRNVRAGHAFAEGAARHGRSAQRHNARQAASVLGWAVVLPLVAAMLARSTRGWSLLGLAVYPLHAATIARTARREGRARSAAEGLLWGAACVVGRWPQVQGMWRYLHTRIGGGRSAIIEYRGPRREHAASVNGDGAAARAKGQ
ncbi:MAG: glycosyltransferase [Phycisphaeraceae bacterium]